MSIILLNALNGCGKCFQHAHSRMESPPHNGDSWSISSFNKRKLSWMWFKHLCSCTTIVLSIMNMIHNSWSHSLVYAYTIHDMRIWTTTIHFQIEHFNAKTIWCIYFHSFVIRIYCIHIWSVRQMTNVRPSASLRSPFFVFRLNVQLTRPSLFKSDDRRKVSIISSCWGKGDHPPGTSPVPMMWIICTDGFDRIKINQSKSLWFHSMSLSCVISMKQYSLLACLWSTTKTLPDQFQVQQTI